MSRSDRSKRDEERSLRRARRLAEREQLRAERKAKEAERAAERAERLAERADRKRRRRTSEREIEKSIEDLVDEVAEKWSRKAETWIHDQAEKLREENYGHTYDDDVYAGETKSGTGAGERDHVSTRRSSERYRARRRGHSRRRRGSFGNRVRSGRGLYRDSRHKRVCGVCAGIADYLQVERWQVRLVAVLGLIFIPSVTLTTYFIAYFLMDDKPYYRQVTDQFEEVPDDDDDFEDAGAVNEETRAARRQRGPTAGMSSAHAMRVAKQKFSDIEERLRAMETHVTSSRFELQRELKQIADDEPDSPASSRGLGE